MPGLELVKRHRCFDGWQEIYKHRSTATRTDMRFSVYVPDAAAREKRPAVYFLSGLTCTEENFTTKAGAQRYASELGLVLIAPDTSPRGAGIDGEATSWDFGVGAGFYVNATQTPWSSNYRMYDYAQTELPELVEAHLPVEKGLRAIMGHSMGGHGALVLALREPERWKSVSAFSPICAPAECPWGLKAFTGYLGEDRATWSGYDATQLVTRGARVRGSILIDQGGADEFLEKQLMPERLKSACEARDLALDLRIHDGYDHSYYFIATFVGEHLRKHAKALGV